MNRTDFLLRGVLKKEKFRFVFADISSTITEGIKIHDTDPVASAVLAEALGSATLLSPLLEGEERYSIRWEYPEGQVKGLIADIDAYGAVRGLIKESYLMGKAETPDDIYGKGSGHISVVKSIEGKILNSGRTRADLASPAADIGFFFSVSDQLETEVVIASIFNANPLKPVKRCCGMLLQAMPDCDLKELEAYRQRMNTAEFKELLLKEMPIEKQLWTLLSYIAKRNDNAETQADITYEFAPSPEFKCSCSQEKMREAMKTLGKAELKKIFAAGNDTPQITCQFCHKKYRFQKTDFTDLLG